MKGIATAGCLGLALASQLSTATADDQTVVKTIPAEELHEASERKQTRGEAEPKADGEALVQGSANEESDCD